MDARFGATVVPILLLALQLSKVLYSLLEFIHVVVVDELYRLTVMHSSSFILG